MDQASIDRAYARLSRHYDLLFERVFDGGRRRIFRALPDRPAARVLEVGVGTGLSLPLYPKTTRVVGIDYSGDMLRCASERIHLDRLPNVSLLRMDATNLVFPDGTFDAVIAAYVISATPHPERVIAEMWRVCRSGGRILFLNHFLSENTLLARVERGINRWTKPWGFRTDLELAGLLQQTGLRPDRIERVNLFGMWRLVVCTKRKAGSLTPATGSPPGT
ncbi:MAG: methyltransferase domain-containing protein [Planctomycetes bacterium]|nr:methyltransferase domain-containing protein [Planctomycetota bacterium]